MRRTSSPPSLLDKFEHPKTLDLRPHVHAETEIHRLNIPDSLMRDDDDLLDEQQHPVSPASPKRKRAEQVSAGRSAFAA